jgi:serine/threonine protein kinase
MSLSLYPIIKELGDGGFGKTYLAINTLLPSHPHCVVKQLKPVVNDPQLQELIQERFEKEGAILESLGNGSNEMIPRLYAYFIERDEFYLVQEYVDGQTLSDRVRTQGLFTEQQVRDWLVNILPTLTYVHSRGIVHRDIKPDNIMLRQRDNKPILIDFGAVKETMSTIVTNSGNSSRSIVIGTPGFMPIEQMVGRPMYSSDIYSLGLTAIYLLTGKMPAEMATDPGTGNVNWQPHTVNVSSQLIGILNKATQTLLNARYTNAQEMLQALSSGHKQPTTVQDRPSSTILSPLPTGNPHPEGIHTPTQPQFDRAKPKSSNDSSRAVTIGVGVGSSLLILGLLLGKNIMGTDIRRTTDRQPQQIAPVVTPSAVSPDTRVAKVAPQADNPNEIDGYYVISDRAYVTKDKSQAYITKLKADGYKDALYFWLPDYPNLSDKNLYVVSPGKFRQKQACQDFLSSYISQHPDAYCVFASTKKNTPPDRFYLRQSKQTSASDDYTWLSQRLVSNPDLQGKTAYDLDIMRNSIFTRYGRKFQTPGIQEYFDRQSWYQAKYSHNEFPTNLMSVTEHKNVSYIDDYQTRYNLHYFR